MGPLSSSTPTLCPRCAARELTADADFCPACSAEDVGDELAQKREHKNAQAKARMAAMRARRRANQVA